MVTHFLLWHSLTWQILYVEQHFCDKKQNRLASFLLYNRLQAPAETSILTLYIYSYYYKYLHPVPFSCRVLLGLYSGTISIWNYQTKVNNYMRGLRLKCMTWFLIQINCTTSPRFPMSLNLYKETEKLALLMVTKNKK